MKAWISHLKRALKAGRADIYVMLGTVALIYGNALFFGFPGVAGVVGYFLADIARHNWGHTR